MDNTVYGENVVDVDEEGLPVVGGEVLHLHALQLPNQLLELQPQRRLRHSLDRLHENVRILFIHKKVCCEISSFIAKFRSKMFMTMKQNN